MGKYTTPMFLADQLGYHAAAYQKDLSGQTVVVVGANVGLGYEAAKHFSTMGAARVIMACRSKERGSEAVERVQKETGLKNTELMLVDLADLASTAKFAADLEAKVDRLDLLVLNAGLVSNGPKRQATVDGWEQAIQVNVVASSILALLLLPLMIKTSRERHAIPRTVIVASAVHFWAARWEKEITEQPGLLKALSDLETFNPINRYWETKLFNILFTRALNERLRATHPTIIVNAVNPGLCTTNLTRNADIPWDMRVRQAVLSVSAEVGSRELVWAALAGSEQAGSLRGQYISRNAVVEPSDFVLSEEGRVAQDRIWREIVAVGEKVDPKIGQIVKEYLLDV